VKDETRAFLFSKFGRGEKFDYVDIDPFGSPAPYLPAMISACKDGAIASVTATDTAALCGVYPLVCRRRYGSKSLNNAFHHETAVRILFNAIRSQAGMLDRGVVPLAAHSTRHYIRVFARIEDGAAKADGSLKGEGYVNVCSRCADASTSGLPGMTCERCGGKLRTAGPMWTGKMTEPDVLSKVSDSSKRLGLVNATRILDGLSGVDSFPPWSYRIDDICSELKLPTAPDHRVRQVLKEAGYRSSKQPFEKTGLKTDAPISAVKDAVRQVMGKG
jgi:tRNA (guanine26-N2/guanine27-N2)-dimethyltransferase